MGTRQVRFLCVALAAIVGVVTSCGDEGQRGATRDTPLTTVGSDAPSPFAVDALPPGFVLEAAGQGTSPLAWGTDEFGSDEPLSVLTAIGHVDGPDTVLVSTTGYAGYQGQLAQASAGHMSGSIEESIIDGAEAIYVRDRGTADARLDPWVGELVVARTPEVAIRVRAVGAEPEDLVPFVRATSASTNSPRHPVVDMEGYETTAWIDADARVAMQRPSVAKGSASVPGPPSGLALGWVGPDQSVAVLMMAGRSADLGVFDHLDIADSGLETARSVVVAGRPARIVRWRFSEAVVLATTTPWHDLLVVGVDGATDSGEELARTIAGSVRRVDDGEWSGLVARPDGGPGLHPDPGASEVIRGDHDGQEWLLQTGRRGESIDECLKLPAQQRICATGMIDGAAGTVRHHVADREAVPLSPFILVSTTEKAAAVRVHTAEGEVRERLTVLPDDTGSAAVVFVDLPTDKTVIPSCLTAPATEGIAVIRVGLLDETGREVACLGLE